jgi:hypothetical protein
MVIGSTLLADISKPVMASVTAIKLGANVSVWKVKLIMNND